MAAASGQRHGPGQTETSWTGVSPTSMHTQPKPAMRVITRRHSHGLESKASVGSDRAAKRAGIDRAGQPPWAGRPSPQTAWDAEAQGKPGRRPSATLQPTPLSQAGSRTWRPAAGLGGHRPGTETGARP